MAFCGERASGNGGAPDELRRGVAVGKTSKVQSAMCPQPWWFGCACLSRRFSGKVSIYQCLSEIASGTHYKNCYDWDTYVWDCNDWDCDDGNSCSIVVGPVACILPRND